MMRRWLGRPDKVMDWLSSSFVSAIMLGVMWMLAMYPMVFLGGIENIESKNWLIFLFALAALATHGLLWWQVLRGGWVMLRDSSSSTGLLLGTVLWLSALLVFQLLCLLCWYCIATSSVSVGDKSLWHF